MCCLLPARRCQSASLAKAPGGAYKLFILYDRLVRSTENFSATAEIRARGPRPGMPVEPGYLPAGDLDSRPRTREMPHQADRNRSTRKSRILPLARFARSGVIFSISGSRSYGQPDNVYFCGPVSVRPTTKSSGWLVCTPCSGAIETETAAAEATVATVRPTDGVLTAESVGITLHWHKPFTVEAERLCARYCSC